MAEFEQALLMLCRPAFLWPCCFDSRFWHGPVVGLTSPSPAVRCPPRRLLRACCGLIKLELEPVPVPVPVPERVPVALDRAGWLDRGGVNGLNNSLAGSLLITQAKSVRESTAGTPGDGTERQRCGRRGLWLADQTVRPACPGVRASYSKVLAPRRVSGLCTMDMVYCRMTHNTCMYRLQTPFNTHQPVSFHLVSSLPCSSCVCPAAVSVSFCLQRDGISAPSPCSARDLKIPLPRQPFPPAPFASLYPQSLYHQLLSLLGQTPPPRMIPSNPQDIQRQFCFGATVKFQTSTAIQHVPLDPSAPPSTLGPILAAWHSLAKLT